MNVHLLFSLFSFVTASELDAMGEALIANVKGHIDSWNQQLVNVSSDPHVPCQKIVELSYLHRDRIQEELAWLNGNFSLEEELYQSDPQGSAAWVLSSVSQASNMLAAHAHISSHLAVLRQDCLTEHLRLLGAVSIRHQKSLLELNLRALWYVYQGTVTELINTARILISQAASVFEADLLTLQSVLQRTSPQEFEDAPTYKEIEADGTFPTLELLHQHTFKEEEVDVKFVQLVLRKLGANLSTAILPSVADFGGGNGAFARFLNQTGRVLGFSFDGAPEVHLATKGATSFANFARFVDLWRTFDWVICFRVLEFVRHEFHTIFMRNIYSHAEQGAIVSYPVQPPFDLEEVLEDTGLVIDTDSSDLEAYPQTIINGVNSRLFVLKRTEQMLHKRPAD